MKRIPLQGRFANIRHHAIMQPKKIGYHQTHNIHAGHNGPMHMAVLGEGKKKMMKPLKFKF